MTINKSMIKTTVTNQFTSLWYTNINDSDVNPLLRTYKLFTNEFKLQPYLKIIENYNHRTALSKFRLSSHCLEIERGRHKQPKPPVCQRLCPYCLVVDDEQHLLFSCQANKTEREDFFVKIKNVCPNFTTSKDNFVFLMSTDNEYILRPLAKFVSDSLDIRERASQLCMLNQFVNIFSYI